ncbi:MAG: tripartite tricarboxylate transporter substrate binding protein [Acetobacterales bacterium]
MRFAALGSACAAVAIAIAPMATASAQSGTSIPNLPESTWKPEKPVEFVVQAGAGGGSDIFARTMAEIMRKEGIVESPINVVNKPGGSGAIAYAYVSTKKADPHVIATATSSYLTTPIQGQSPVSHKDFEDIAIVAVEDFVGVVRTESPYKTLTEMIDAAKKSPNSIRVGGSSVGSSDNIIETLLEKATGAKLNFIVFLSGGQANAALLGGNVDFAGPNPSEAQQLIEAGRLRPIAMFSPERLDNWPDVPTAREQGIDVTLEQHRGVIAPSGLTDQQSLFWQNAFVKLFQTEDFKKYMQNNGLRPLLRAGDDAEAYIAERSKFYEEILTELGLAKKG